MNTSTSQYHTQYKTLTTKQPTLISCYTTKNTQEYSSSRHNPFKGKYSSKLKLNHIFSIKQVSHKPKYIKLSSKSKKPSGRKLNAFNNEQYLEFKHSHDQYKLPKYASLDLFCKLPHKQKANSSQGYEVIRKLFTEGQKHEKKEKKGIKLKISKKQNKPQIHIHQIKQDKYWEEEVVHRSMEILQEFRSIDHSPHKKKSIESSRSLLQSKQKQYVKDRHIKLIISPNRQPMTR